MEQRRYCAVVANEITELSNLYMCCIRYSKRRTFYAWLKEAGRVIALRKVKPVLIGFKRTMGYYTSQ